MDLISKLLSKTEQQKYSMNQSLAVKVTYQASNKCLGCVQSTKASSEEAPAPWPLPVCLTATHIALQILLLIHYRSLAHAVIV